MSRLSHSYLMNNYFLDPEAIKCDQEEDSSNGEILR